MSDTKTLYTADGHVTGGRDGAARSGDGRLDVSLSTPGGPGRGTNPEQLFAAGWSACFQGAMGIAARAKGVTLPTGRRRLFARRPAQRPCARHRPGCRAPDHRNRAPHLPLLEGDQGQYRRRGRARLSPAPRRMT